MLFEQDAPSSCGYCLENRRLVEHLDLDQFSIHHILVKLGMLVAQTTGRISAIAASKRLTHVLQELLVDYF